MGSPSVRVVSPFCVRGGPVEWRGVVGCVLSPCSDWVSPFTLSPSFPRCPVSSCIVPFLFCLVCGGMMQCEMGGAVRVMNGGVCGGVASVVLFLFSRLFLALSVAALLV